MFYAKEKMAETLLVSELSVGENQGEFQDAYQWHTSVSWVGDEEDEENLPVDLMKISVRLTWLEGEKEKSFSIDTLKAVKQKQSIKKDQEGR